MQRSLLCLQGTLHMVVWMLWAHAMAHQVVCALKPSTEFNLHFCLQACFCWVQCIQISSICSGKESSVGSKFCFKSPECLSGRLHPFFVCAVQGVQRKSTSGLHVHAEIRVLVAALVHLLEVHLSQLRFEVVYVFVADSNLQVSADKSTTTTKGLHETCIVFFCFFEKFDSVLLMCSIILIMKGKIFLKRQSENVWRSSCRILAFVS